MAKKRANGEGSIRKRGDNCWEARYSYGHYIDSMRKQSASNMEAFHASL